MLLLLSRSGLLLAFLVEFGLRRLLWLLRLRLRWRRPLEHIQSRIECGADVPPQRHIVSAHMSTHKLKNTDPHEPLVQRQSDRASPIRGARSPSGPPPSNSAARLRPLRSSSGCACCSLELISGPFARVRLIPDLRGQQSQRIGQQALKGRAVHMDSGAAALEQPLTVRSTRQRGSSEM